MSVLSPWDLIDVDLANPPARIDAKAGCNALFVTYRFQGLVLGQEVVMREELPLRGTEVPVRAAGLAQKTVRDWLALSPGAERPAWTPRAASHHWFGPDDLPDDPITALSAAIAARRNRPVPVSGAVAICTRHRPQQLADCLASIRAEIEAGREVIVVDNGPDPETEACVRAYPTVRYLPEPLPGLSRARNAAISATTAEVVIFVDDDVRPEPGWVEPLLQCFASPDVGAVCGMVLPHSLDTAAQIAFQFELGFGGMGFLPQRFDRDFVNGGWRGVPVWTIGAGANMAVRKSASLKIGGFDERLGPGRSVGGSEDSEFWHRLLFAGNAIIYEPMSVVRHDHRRDTEAMSTQTYGYSVGHLVALFAQFGENRDWGDLHRAFVTIPKWHLGRILRQPMRRLRGYPDPHLWDWVRGYLRGLGSIGLVFQKRTRGP